MRSVWNSSGSQKQSVSQSLHHGFLQPGHLFRESCWAWCESLHVLRSLGENPLRRWLCVCGNRHMAFYTLPRPAEELAATMTPMRSCELVTWEEKWGKQKKKKRGGGIDVQLKPKQKEHCHSTPSSPFFSLRRQASYMRPATPIQP